MTLSGLFLVLSGVSGAVSKRRRAFGIHPWMARFVNPEKDALAFGPRVFEASTVCLLKQRLFLGGLQRAGHVQPPGQASAQRLLRLRHVAGPAAERGGKEG